MSPLWKTPTRLRLNKQNTTLEKPKFWQQKNIHRSQLAKNKLSKTRHTVASVPWARHNSDYTYEFETAVTWLTLHTTMKDVSEYFQIKWSTVGSIAQRVSESVEKEQRSNRFDNLEEIGIDETSYKKGHKYMTNVVNHKTGHLVWAKKGYGKEVLTTFFKELTVEQRAKIRYVTADGARWISDCVRNFCSNAKRCVNPFHVVGWATGCLDEVRRGVVRQVRKDVVAEGKSGSGVFKKGVWGSW